MATELLTEKYADRLDGVLHCYDRVVLTGSIQPWCYAQGMTGYLYAHGIRIFDYVQFAQPLREQICANAEAVAQEAGLEIEYLRKKNFRKEDASAPFWNGVVSSPGWCISSRPWSLIFRTNPGITSRPAKPI